MTVKSEFICLADLHTLAIEPHVQLPPHEVYSSCTFFISTLMLSLLYSLPPGILSFLFKFCSIFQAQDNRPPPQSLL